MGRWLSIACGALLILLAAFGFGMYSASRQTAVFQFFKSAQDTVQQAWSQRENWTGERPVHWTGPRRYEGDGVVLNELPQPDRDLVLLQGFFDGGLEVRLIGRDGRPVRRWPIRGTELLKDLPYLRNPPTLDWDFDTHGAVALPDGSVVFNLDHVALVKLDKCGDLVWQLDRPVHHSVDLNADGTFWVASARHHYEGDPAPHPMFRPPFAEDVLLKVSADGEVLKEISLLDAMVESDELGVLTLTGRAGPTLVPGVRYDFSEELFHLNDVEELPAALAADFPGFTAGDLLVSLRNRNLVMVLDGSTGRVKWRHVGGWIRQHDPDWNSGGFISVFDNNRDETATGEILGSSRIVRVRPDTLATEVRFGTDGDEYFHATRRGKHQVLGDGRLLITDAVDGRVMEVDAENRPLWVYVNGYDEEYTARIGEAIVYDKSYFAVDDWRCPGDG